MSGASFTEKDLERILRDSRFTNDEHKEALRERLFEEGAGDRLHVFELLSEEELALASGGKKLPEETRPGPGSDLADDSVWKKRMGLPW